MEEKKEFYRLLEGTNLRELYEVKALRQPVAEFTEKEGGYRLSFLTGAGEDQQTIYYKSRRGEAPKVFKALKAIENALADIGFNRVMVIFKETEENESPPVNRT